VRRDDTLLQTRHARIFGVDCADGLCGAMSKMSWLGWSADIKKRACRYLLQRYLGQFLEELTLDQLTVDLYNGTGRVVNVSLDVQVRNMLFFVLGIDCIYSFLFLPFLY